MRRVNQLPKDVYSVFINDWGRDRVMFQKGRNAFLQLTTCGTDCECTTCAKRIETIERISKRKNIRFLKKHFKINGDTHLFIGLRMPRDTKNFMSFFAEKTGMRIWS